MPKVDGKDFPYTPEGIAAAKQAKAQSYEGGGGVTPIVDASARSESYQLGGKVPGQQGFGVNPNANILPNPFDPDPRPPNPTMVGQNPLVPQYEKGGKVERKARRAARREARQERRNLRKISRKQKKGKLKVTTSAKTLEDTKQLKATGKIRPGAKSVEVTKGGAYASYKKDSKPAKSFRSAFSSARGAGKKSFEWDGRSYTTQTADDVKKK